jgi:hypothetical protein
VHGNCLIVASGISFGGERGCRIPDPWVQTRSARGLPPSLLTNSHHDVHLRRWRRILPWTEILRISTLICCQKKLRVTTPGGRCVWTLAMTGERLLKTQILQDCDRDEPGRGEGKKGGNFPTRTVTDEDHVSRWTPSARRAGGFELGSVRQEHLRTHRPDPSRNSFSHPRPLRHGQRAHRDDSCVSWLEGGVRITLLVLDESRQNSRLT